MVSKQKARKQSFKRKRDKINADLGGYVKSPLGVPAPSGEIAGRLRAVRALGALGMPLRKRRALRKRIVTDLADTLAREKIRPRDLGLKGNSLAQEIDLLAELLVQMLERVNYHEFGINELRRKKKGLRGVFAGELFELLVLNMPSIQDELRLLSGRQLAELNAAMRNHRARLINAHGVQLALTGTWTGVHRVTDIYVRKGKSRLKFTDFGYVTFLNSKSGKLYVSFLLETEVKMPAAAGKFREQIGVKQARFTDADQIEFTIDGADVPVSFAPADIIFDSRNINRFALDPIEGPQQTWRVQSTSSGGYHEAFWRVGLVVDVSGLRALVEAAFAR